MFLEFNNNNHYDHDDHLTLYRTGTCQSWRSNYEGISQCKRTCILLDWTKRGKFLKLDFTLNGGSNIVK